MSNITVLEGNILENLEQTTKEQPSACLMTSCNKLNYLLCLSVHGHDPDPCFLGSLDAQYGGIEVASHVN